ncbi:pseudouridine synthase [Gilbertella persicaria]|uniref:pseudouridine synthase n=1 Tax=Gilbertella persicaria TaxID=101096 RepID=UPI00222103DE|nr:pseudouridine synthase [Gilbertella persicaria]KAI8082684.1 pseudouridine synthase [Gilbertella persicaria]
MLFSINHNRSRLWHKQIVRSHLRWHHVASIKPIKGTISLRKENDLHTASYYFENGLRKVKPYYFHFRAYAKERMFNSTVLQVFLNEYRGRSEQYYRFAIEKGLITVNHKKTTPDTLLKRQDLISHVVHRHEPPVTDQPIRIIYEDDQLLVINKPGSIQVHPSGRYRHNTVLHILRKEYGYDRLFPSNRLDRITSGLMLICKNPVMANDIGLQMRSGEIQKEYICRVSGEFPRERIVCREPIKTLSYTVSLNYVHPQGKSCATIFERVSYNGRTSLVRCKPLSGRTHQIRVHLRYLGYPIANDPIYSYATAWSDRMLLLSPLKETESILNTMVKTAPYDYMDDDPLNKTGLPRCDVCQVPIIQTDPQPTQLALWLHAYKYSGKQWSFETPHLPAWANESFTDDTVIIPATF